MRCHVVAILLCLADTLAIKTRLNSRLMKCVSEDFPKHTTVTLSYEFMDVSDDNFAGIVSVHSPRGEETFLKQGVRMDEVTFQTTAAGYYRFCFASLDKNGQFYAPPGKPSTTLAFNIFHAGSLIPKNAANKEDVYDTGVLADMLKSDAQELLDRLAEHKDSEAARRDTNETTNSNVTWFAAANIAVLLGLAIWQSRGLKVFLQKKKVI